MVKLGSSSLRRSKFFGEFLILLVAFLQCFLGTAAAPRIEVALTKTRRGFVARVLPALLALVNPCFAFAFALRAFLRLNGGS